MTWFYNIQKQFEYTTCSPRVPSLQFSFTELVIQWTICRHIVGIVDHWCKNKSSYEGLVNLYVSTFRHKQNTVCWKSKFIENDVSVIKISKNSEKLKSCLVMEAVNSGLIYGLEFQCRALASLESDDDAVRFVVGTQGPRASNQVCKLYISMISLITHTVAHSTRPSFRLKTNNQPLKKFWSLAVSWVKVIKNWVLF